MKKGNTMKHKTSFFTVIGLGFALNAICIGAVVGALWVVGSWAYRSVREGTMIEQIDKATGTKAP